MPYNRSIVVGEAEIIALVDAVPDPVAPSWSFPEVPAAAWAGHAEGSLDDAKRFRPNLGCFAVRMPGRTLLVDLGIGPGPNAYLKGISGRLPELLAEAGLRFSDVAAVAFTHLHMDHVGWAATRGTDGDTRISCIGAPHYVSATELAYWRAAPESSGAHHRGAFDSCVVPLIHAGLVHTVQGDAEFQPGLRYLPTPGHTPGHSSVMIQSAAQTIVIAGDVFHCPAQVQEPNWSHRADLDPGSARETRKDFLARAAEGEWIIAAGHFRDGWMFGRIEQTRDGYVFNPI